MVDAHRERAVPPGSAALRGELLSEVEGVLRERRAPVACGRSLEAMDAVADAQPVGVRARPAAAVRWRRRRIAWRGQE